MAGTSGVNLPGKGEKTAAQNTEHPILVGENTIGVRKIFCYSEQSEGLSLERSEKSSMCSVCIHISFFIM